MDRASCIKAIEDTIGRRRLLWVGTRGTDAQPLLAVEQFEGVVGLLAPLGVPSWPEGSEKYLEHLSGHRVDLNRYSVDQDPSPHCAALGDHLRDVMTPGTLVVTYRPTALLAAAYYPRMEHATYLGMFHGHQEAFEHKPWVESELSARGVPIIPQRYFSDSDSVVMREWVESLSTGGRKYVLRANYSDGGAGLMVGHDGRSDSTALQHDGGFLAVSPFLEPSVPLNVSGCVFPSGRVTVRSPSLQLIGLPSCTTRRFGYCGNDFAAVHGVLGDDGLDELEGIASRTGTWLWQCGYVGAFGLDALLWNGRIYLTEVNPRFQGCSAAAAEVMAEVEGVDIYLDHLAAMLGIQAPPDQAPLRDQGRLQAMRERRLAQVVCYNTGATQRLRRGVVVPDLDYGELKGTPDEDVLVEPEAMLFKLFVYDTVTATGGDLPQWLSNDIARLKVKLFDQGDPLEDHDDLAASESGWDLA